MLAPLGLALRAFFLLIGEARVTSPERETSQSEATASVLPLEANLAFYAKLFRQSRLQ